MALRQKKGQTGILFEVSEKELHGFMDVLPEEEPTPFADLRKIIPGWILKVGSIFGQERRIRHMMLVAIDKAPFEGGWYPCAQDRSGGGYFKTRDVRRVELWAETKRKKGQGALDDSMVIRAAAERGHVTA
jgi:hypothetical protein